MKYLIAVFALLLCLVTFLFGCRHSTIITLPEKTPATIGTTAKTTLPMTEDPTAEPTASATEATTEPTDESVPPATETAAHTTIPVTEPAAVPPTVPTTIPSTAPATEPTVEPTTVPVTEPTTAPTTVSTTEPTAEPTAEFTSHPTVHPVYDISAHTIGDLEYSLLEAINRERNQNDLSPLTLDPTLCALSAIRSYECSKNTSHVRPNGRSGLSVLEDYDYAHWSATDERIHHGTAGLSVSIILKAWMRNTDFSADILSGVFTHIGIGTYTADSITYIVLLFRG